MFTVGTDAEFFLKDASNEFVSAIPYIKNGKHSPKVLPSGGNVTHDNVALEFATPVANDENEFIEVVGKTMRESITDLPKGIVLDTSASVDFPKSELDHEEARVFGCDPDFDAWELIINEVPFEACDGQFRSVGGHLHIGHVEGVGNDFLLEPMGKVFTVKALDVMLGIPMTIMDNNNASIARRDLYGKAGCHRPTNYGVEYRSMSNFWLFSPKLVQVVHKLADDALASIRNGSAIKLVEKIGEKEIQRVINQGDKEAAKNLWSDLISKEVSKDSKKIFTALSRRKRFNIYKEWSL